MDAARRFNAGGGGGGGNDNEDEKLGTPFEIFSKEAAFKQSRKGAGIGYEEKVQSFLHDQQGREYHGDSAAAPGNAQQQQQQQAVPGRPGTTQDQPGAGDRGRQQRHQQEQLPFGGQGKSTVAAAAAGRNQGPDAKPRYKPIKVRKDIIFL